MAFCHWLLSNPVGSPQEERKVEVEEVRKLIPTWKVSGWAGFEPITYCFSHENISDCNNLATRLSYITWMVPNINIQKVIINCEKIKNKSWFFPQLQKPCETNVSCLWKNKIFLTFLMTLETLTIILSWGMFGLLSQISLDI